MPTRNLSELYHTIIKQHEQEPFHFAKIANADHIIEAYNPICGDQFRLFLQIENDSVKAAHFHGYGCAISKASTSVLVKKIQGLALEEVRVLLAVFQDVVSGNIETIDEELSAFAAARQFPERLPCATLGWDALRNFLPQLAEQG